MNELTDYKGQLKTDLKWEDFSKEFLAQLMRSWQWAYMKQAEIYGKVNKKRHGAEEADSTDLEVWDIIGRTLGPKFAKVGGIQFNTISDCLKVLQLYPDSILSPMYEADIKIVSDTHAILTMIKCRTLDYYERDAPHMVKSICYGFEAQCMQNYCVDPRLRVTPRVHPPLPPKKRVPGELFCQFDYKLVK